MKQYKIQNRSQKNSQSCVPLTKERNIRDFFFGDTPIGDEITIRAYLQDRAWVTAS